MSFQLHGRGNHAVRSGADMAIGAGARFRGAVATGQALWSVLDPRGRSACNGWSSHGASTYRAYSHFGCRIGAVSQVVLHAGKGVRVEAHTEEGDTMSLLLSPSPQRPAAVRPHGWCVR